MTKNNKKNDPTEAPEVRDISTADFVANILPRVSMEVAKAISTGSSQEKGRWDAPNVDSQVQALEALRPTLGSQVVDAGITKIRADFVAPVNPFDTLQRAARERVVSLGGKTKKLRA